MKYTRHIGELIDQLQELCPTTFPKKPAGKVPLADNVHLAIKDILGVNHATARSIAYLWKLGHRYDAACSVAGSPKFNPDNSIGGFVTTGEAKYHKGKLDEYYATRVPPKDYTFEGESIGIFRWLRDKLCPSKSTGGQL